MDTRDTTAMINPSTDVPEGPNSSGGISTRAISCGGYKGTYYTISNTSKVKKVTHASRHSNFTPDNATTSYTSEYRTQLDAGVTFTVGSSADFNGVLAKMSATTNVSLALNKSKTTASNVGITATIRPGKFVVVAAGNTKVTGNWTKNVCTSGSAGLTTPAKGTARSFGVRENTAIQCGLSAPAGSLAAIAKSRYC
ncbi:hypothetical protein ACFY5D_20790 [Paeniglutamicibacter sp. NPDC012692]|uniref:hypothetical protein n=1 Tax=Paeniglutamicibacter sp. NPDC012692 TaxID=3364388 RepID=UPI0036CB7692